MEAFDPLLSKLEPILNGEPTSYIEEPWTIIESYFKGQHLDRLVRHQLESYNNFVSYQIIKTIEMFNPVHIASEHDYDSKTGKYSLEIYVTFENFHIYRPQIHENNGAIKLMFPQDARLRNFTYASAMTVDMNIKYVVRNGADLENCQTVYKTLPKIHIGKLPIMLKSSICVLNQYKHVNSDQTGECKFDAGGYFIINGSEKTVLGQERAAENRVYCYNISKNSTKYNWMAEIKSVPDFKCISPKQISMMKCSKNNGFGFPIVIQIPRIKQPMPLFVVFRAIGVVSDKEICEKILLNVDSKHYEIMLNALQASIIDANKWMTKEEALKSITTHVMYTPINMDKETGAKKKHEFALDVLSNDLFPHCKTLTQKTYFLGYMTNKLLHAHFEWVKGDDRDAYPNKCVDLTGSLLNNLFRNYFNKLVKDMEKQVIREINNGSWRSTDDYERIINMTNIYKIIKSTTIENGIKRALSTGDFGIKHSNSNKVGVAQVLNRLTYISSLSHARRISTPTDKSGKLIPPRKLHNTSWGFLCPAETPEGQSVGIVKNLSYMSHITIHSDSAPLYDYILPHIVDIETLSSSELFDKVKVFINGTWIGITNEPFELYSMLKEKKYNGIINVYTSIVFDYKMKEIRVCNNGGRLMRPLLRVSGNCLLIHKPENKDVIPKLRSGEYTWEDLFTNCKLPEAVLEYIDAEEQSWSFIAVKPQEIEDAVAASKNACDNLQKYTHCEIHPSTIFGIMGSCIPFPEHNQSPRNCYQCLDVNELVLMANGTKKRIADVKIGDEVTSFHPKTMQTSITKVVNHYVRETDKKIYKITTKSGREIIATEDHKFMTVGGWSEVRNMNVDTTKIGILINQNVVDNTTSKMSCILDIDSFVNSLSSEGFELTLVNKYVNELQKQNLLPLYNSNDKLWILSRMFGYLLADGSINIYTRYGKKFASCSFDFGTIEDVTDFEEDVKLCGFRTCNPYASSRSFNNVTHSTFAVSHSGSFPALLIALGVSYGKKTETSRKNIPDWIVYGSKLVKREFMSGFQGGDGCKIRWNKMKFGYNFVCAETSQQIAPAHKESMVHFMKQCVNIINEFEIEVSDVKLITVEQNRVKVSFKISDKHSNLMQYFDNIGYRYSHTKCVTSAKIIEYLRFKNCLFDKHKNFIQQIRNYHDEKLSNSSIANIMNIRCSNVSDIVKSYKNNRQISMRKLKEDNIVNWFSEVETKEKCMFVPIESIVEVENRLISDITVESENHSFIAGNNFLSSNCAQGKQAMGIYTTNFDTRMDKTAYLLNYPTRPLVDTRIMNMIKLNNIPSGTNVIVAIMTHTGYNQEDSLLFNKASLDRGLFVATIYHTEKDEDKQKINGDEEIRCKPDPVKTKGMKFGNYDKVNSKGIVPENTLVENRDIIISKIVPIKENRNDPTKLIKYEDQSKIYRTAEETYIDKNYIDRNGDGYNFAKVRLRTVRKPVIGDKFSSRHGQKGTIGNIIPECDMPFTANGVKPDIIINPHAIPSRMTIGQLKETVLGKTLVSLGLFGDGTSFGEFDVKDICKELQKVGYESNGNEIMYSGLTGEQFESSIFIGPVFYQRLKHMVNDKTHSRSIGPMVNLTRQPAEGRSRDGGLRFGEMERDCESAETIVGLANGLGIKIKNMSSQNWEVLGWSEKHNGIVPAKQCGFMYKGDRECVELTFNDGRKKTCTPEHPILTSTNEWVKAKDVICNSTKIKASVTCPCVDFVEEMNECAGWSLDVGDLLLRTDTEKNYLKCLAFARILGYLITDGHVSKSKYIVATVFLGHMIDVRSFLSDLKLFCPIKQEKFKSKNLYCVRIPAILAKEIAKLDGILAGRKVAQPGTLPAFILDEDCPRPIVREFLAGMFGGDGHTSVLGMHRGKRDLLSSVSFSQTKYIEHIDSLTQMMQDIKKLFQKCGIEKITLQNPKKTSYSKEKNTKSHEMILHLEMEELIPFAEKVGFRYCCHKSQRLEAAVSYRRLRVEVTRQHNWLVKRVDELTRFSEIKKEAPTKIVPTQKAILQAVEELKKTEPLLHEYAIPSTHDITDHLIKGTQFGKFTSKSFPTAEQFLENIGALSWFLEELPTKPIMEDDVEDELDLVESNEEEDVNVDIDNVSYGVYREMESLPTMNLTVIDVRPAGVHPVYDIEVEEVHSFLANGVVAHNCMISHGASRFTKERLYDVSDKYQVHVCNKCGLIASYNNELHIHLCRTCGNRSDFSFVKIPYACKLMMQELIAMNVCSRFVTEN